MLLPQRAVDVINTNLCVGRTCLLVGEADNKQMICVLACQRETGLQRETKWIDGVQGCVWDAV